MVLPMARERAMKARSVPVLFSGVPSDMQGAWYPVGNDQYLLHQGMRKDTEVQKGKSWQSHTEGGGLLGQCLRFAL